MPYHMFLSIFRLALAALMLRMGNNLLAINCRQSGGGQFMDAHVGDADDVPKLPRTVEVGKWVFDRDPTRLVNIASGGNFWPIGDVVDAHAYPDPDFPFNKQRFGNFVKVVGEFGGHGYPVQGHLWDTARRNWGYGGLPENEQEFRSVTLRR